MIKLFMTKVALALALTLAGNALADDTSPQKRRVVLQVSDDDEETWEQALKLAENMLENGGGKDKIDIQIVAMSPGILMVVNGSSVAGRVSKAANNGIQMRACAYTLSVRHMSADKLAPGVKTVPFGALEIVDKQKEGWSYIKP
ncbi:MAG TPA: DsrE family protein [Burkholderiales bacterium]|nr:DsrE family protein [Burkholderiales bacterium]